MSGERDLDRLLAGMSPRRNPGTWLFCSLPGAGALAGAQPIATFEEEEGSTVVLEERDAARLGLTATFRSAWITLDVVSDLAAVGFLARVTAALAAEAIPANAFSAFHHDHLFVPVERADEAMAVLERLQAGAGTSAPGR